MLLKSTGPVQVNVWHVFKLCNVPFSNAEKVETSCLEKSSLQQPLLFKADYTALTQIETERAETLLSFLDLFHSLQYHLPCYPSVVVARVGLGLPSVPIYLFIYFRNTHGK